jgi:hypothetical protein
MPTATQSDDLTTTTADRATPDILVCLPPLSSESLQATLNSLSTAFPAQHTLIAAPVPAPEGFDPTRWITTPDRSTLGWVLSAADFAAAAELAAAHNPKVTLLLGNCGENCEGLDAPALQRLAEAVLTRNIDLALPRFRLAPTAGLVNAAILYPLTRALFNADVHFPLALDAALSPRCLQRLAATANRLPHQQEGESLLWPVTEAAIAGLSIRETDAGSAHPAAPSGDFNTTFASVTGSLFADIEAKANFWQRARALPARANPSTSTEPAQSSTDITAQVQEMVDSFHLAHANLQELWSIVLSPQTRLALKKLSLTAPDAFSMEPGLWARIVYDFALAFHQRTLNRGHLLGAMTPLYLAWAASHLRFSGDDSLRATQSIEDTAAAFEAERSYMLSRWRWPDRFNP